MVSLVCLGGFHNQRDCFPWEGHTLELDETRFEHGTLYEIECETVGGEGGYSGRSVSWRLGWAVAVAVVVLPVQRVSDSTQGPAWRS